MSKYNFFQLDVFTDRAFAGNPLAVFPEAEGITDEQMQQMSQGMDMKPPEVIHDPDSADMSSEDSSRMDSAADSVQVFRPRADTTRRQRVRVIRVPPPPPPQVIVPPAPPPIIPPPPPPPPPPPLA